MFGIIETLRSFNKAVDVCFGLNFEGHVLEKIDQFKTSYLAMPNARVTSKVHDVFHQLNDLIFHKNITLGLFSEQVVNSRFSSSLGH